MSFSKIFHMSGDFLPLLIVPNPNLKSFRSSQSQFLWQIHLYFGSFEAVLKLTRHFENPKFLNTITQYVDLFALSLPVFMTDCLCG